MKPIVSVVVYSYYNISKWLDISLRSFKDHLPDCPILIVDHNKRESERNYLKSFGTVIEHPGEQGHSDGIDAATNWCKDNGYDVLLLMEQDCVIKGKDWYNKFLAAINDGYWMVGSTHLDYGGIHPCPSAWLVSEIKNSFSVCPQGNDIYHPRYLEKINLPIITRMPGVSDANIEFWLSHWDCGIKNWFRCAVEDKAKLCEVHDFIHFWCSRKRQPCELPTVLQRMLSPYYRPITLI